MENFISDNYVKVYIRGWINSLQLKKIYVNDCTKEDDHYTVTIHGGFNGYGQWGYYTEQINKIVRHLRGSYIISLKSDLVDDLWELKLGINLKDIHYENT